MTEQQYEYRFETRTRVVARYFYDLNNRKGEWLDEIKPEWSEWRDGSGYNKKGSVYRTLAHVKAAIAQQRSNTGRVKVEHEEGGGGGGR